jgi:glycolate oxidase FAD binding subunit
MTLASRQPEARDAVAGVMPRVVFSPTSLDESVEAMELAAREDMSVAIVGGSTQLGVGHPPKKLDAVIRTDKLARVIEYVPSDMVLSVEAGVTLAKVREVTRAHGQMLALDPPHPDRTTIGGMIATAAFGPSRVRYGAIRDLIIGVTLVRPDGIVAKGGGKVVKNVAGFDLPKVVCGSLGTLGMIATATFRLHPLPQAQGTAYFKGLTPVEVVRLVGKMREAQLEPTRAVALRVGDRYDFAIGFEGFESGVGHQIERLREVEWCEQLDDEHAFMQRHDAVRTGGPLRVKVTALASKLVEVERVVQPLLAALHGGAFVWYASLGIGFASGEIGHLHSATVALETLRESLRKMGGAVVIESAPSELRFDPWGPPPGSLQIMAAMKRRFDPEGRINPGRFVGGL